MPAPSPVSAPSSVARPARRVPVAAFVATALCGAWHVVPAGAQQTPLEELARRAPSEALATPTLPDARPGECYAKVITPAVFAERSEEVVVQEASERVSTAPASFVEEPRRVEVREASTVLEPVPTDFEVREERVLVRERERFWAVDERGTRVASPQALVALGESGTDLDAVEPGSCFVEHLSPVTYRTEPERVLVREASTRIEIEPAVYETLEERVLVKEASTEIVDVPAVFRTETERVLVEPARSVWRPGRGPIERVDDTTGEIMCLVELPARYETVSRTVLDTPAGTETVTVPAEYETVEVERLVTPAAQRTVDVPPEYETVDVERRVDEASFAWTPEGEDSPLGAEPTGERLCLVERPAEYRTYEREIVLSEATVEVTDVPSEYRTIPVQRLEVEASVSREPVPERVETITSKVEIRPSTLAWRPVLCETNMTPEIVADLQRALSREGFDPGPADGVIGAGTLEAVEAFQSARSLDRGGITYQTLQALNVES